MALNTINGVLQVRMTPLTRGFKKLLHIIVKISLDPNYSIAKSITLRTIIFCGCYSVTFFHRSYLIDVGFGEDQRTIYRKYISLTLSIYHANTGPFQAKYNVFELHAFIFSSTCQCDLIWKSTYVMSALFE